MTDQVNHLRDLAHKYAVRLSMPFACEPTCPADIDKVNQVQALLAGAFAEAIHIDNLSNEQADPDYVSDCHCLSKTWRTQDAYDVAKHLKAITTQVQNIVEHMECIDHELKDGRIRASERIFDVMECPHCHSTTASPKVISGKYSQLCTLVRKARDSQGPWTSGHFRDMVIKMCKIIGYDPLA